MSTTIRAPSRTLLRALKSTESSSCRCSRTRKIGIQQRRCISTSQPQREERTTQSSEVPSKPRWAETPAAMKAPVRFREKPPGWRPFSVNGDPDKLDDMYSRFLGKSGPNMLADETKWLAVTHKSFDHGRRGFNDRLAFMGRQILELQTSIGMLTTTASTGHGNSQQDEYGRLPFEHPATDGVEVLNSGAKDYYLQTKAISGVGRQYGIQDVIRWHPRNLDNLNASGIDMVITQAVFAIIGALAMEQGGAVANKVARERVLLLAGLRMDSIGDVSQTEHQQQMVA